jgi:hypothetical protein
VKKEIVSSKLKWVLLLITSTLLFLISCQKQTLKSENETVIEPLHSFAKPNNDIPYQEGSRMLIGDSKINPYTVSNMMTAWNSLASSGTISNTSNFVRTTHYYVKFKPQNSEQYEALHFDSAYALSDLPIESKITMNGDYYHDPSLPDDVPTYQYTAVPVGHILPDSIPYEILDNLYIPEKDGNFQYENGGTNDLFVDKLLNKAYAQTGNYEDTIALTNQSNASASRYTPGGNINVFDTRLQGLIGMEGVRVEARRWFVIYSAYPDFNGNYRMNDSYKRPCNYSIWFGQDRFSVRHNVVNTTFWINGPKITGDWNYTLNNSYQRFAGHVFRGGFRYHNKDIGGLGRPFRWFGKRTVYIAKDAVKSWSGENWIIFPVIRIARYDSKGTEYNSDEVFSTTCHETAHTSHVITMNAGPIQYWQVSGQLQESWPVGVEWFISHIEYNDRGVTNYGEANYNPINPPQYPNRQAYQYWNLGVSNDYTSLFINLVDRENDNTLFFGAPNDQVVGYTLRNIERRILKHCYGISSLGDKLKTIKPIGVTDAQIDLLLSSY